MGWRRDSDAFKKNARVTDVPQTPQWILLKATGEKVIEDTRAYVRPLS
jgi:hypothetical protein